MQSLVGSAASPGELGGSGGPQADMAVEVAKKVAYRLVVQYVHLTDSRGAGRLESRMGPNLDMGSLWPLVCVESVQLVEQADVDEVSSHIHC